MVRIQMVCWTRFQCVRQSRTVWQALPVGPSLLLNPSKTRSSRLFRAAITALCLLLAVVLSDAQDVPEKAVQNQQNGMSTGVPRAPVKDAQSRPITAGGFVDGAPVIFEDHTHAAGLDKFHHKSGTREKSTILETPGSGVALLDYDRDGWLDIYLVNGSTFPALRGNEGPPRAMLLHNNHDGTFTDVTEK